MNKVYLTTKLATLLSYTSTHHANILFNNVLLSKNLDNVTIQSFLVVPNYPPTNFFLQVCLLCKSQILSCDLSYLNLILKFGKKLKEGVW